MVEFLSVSENFFPDLVKSTVALFVVLDPLGIIPIYVALTQKMEAIERVAISKTVVITATALLFAFALAGSQIFAIFGITIPSFMIAGGVLLFIVSIELLTHGEWRFGDATVKEETGVVPLAFPLLAGPGAITAVMISLQTTGLIVTAVSILIVIGITYFILRFANNIYRVLGRRGSMIVTRVFAVFLAAISIQYIVEGAKQIFA